MDGSKRTWTVVFKGDSTAHFKPEETFRIDVPSLSSFTENSFVVRTRWEYDAQAKGAIPRELWIESSGKASSLEDAIVAASPIARLLAITLAFTANTNVAPPEVNMAFDATPQARERDFLEVFLPNPPGLPRQSRMVKMDEYKAVIDAIAAVGDTARISRALHQYDLALRYWHFGGEWLALAHLYMAVEALTDAVIRASADKLGVSKEELAKTKGIDVSEDNWSHQLQVIVRRDGIFQGDNETYRSARRASDGLEHGFLELNEINRRALEVTETTFSYVRRALLNLLELDPEESRDLYERAPKDTNSLRKIIRGQFVGDGSNPAPNGEEYPRLEWFSRVKSAERDGDNFQFTFEEVFTVHCSPEYSFRGQALEVRGRAERDGQSPIRLEAIGEVGRSAGEDSAASLAAISAVLSEANAIASSTVQVALSGSALGYRFSVFLIFSNQVALLESLQRLILDDRPVEAAMLLWHLFLGTGRLQIIAGVGDVRGVALRVTIESLNSMQQMGVLDPAVASIQIDKANAWASMHNVEIPDFIPEPTTAEFFAAHPASVEFLQELIGMKSPAAQFHLRSEETGISEFHTQVRDARLAASVAGEAVLAICDSLTALCSALDWGFDEVKLGMLRQKAERLASGDPRAGARGDV